MATTNNIEFITTAEAAALIRHQPQTLRKWRVQGGGPPFIRLAGRVLYEHSELVAWVTSHRVNSTSESDSGR